MDEAERDFQYQCASCGEGVTDEEAAEEFCPHCKAPLELAEVKGD